MNDILKKLAKSKFRSSFSLKPNDITYIDNKGMETIKKHAYELIEKRLAPSIIPNDGKQTPMRGHPVFIAQHATATCCRNCLEKWHHISSGKELTSQEIDYVVAILMKWIAWQYQKNKTLH